MSDAAVNPPPGAAPAPGKDDECPEDNNRPIRPEEDKNEILAHEWVALTALWDRIKGAVTDQATRDRVQKILDRYKCCDARLHSSPCDWENFNAAELAIGAQLSGAILESEYLNLLVIAIARKLPGVEDYKARAPDFAAGSTVALDVLRSTYLRLLYQLQAFFVQRRSERTYRRKAVDTLLIIGGVLGVLFLAAAAAGFYTLDSTLTPDCSLLGHSGTEPPRCISNADDYFALLLVVIAAVGAMGAGFSRAIAFRSYADSLAFADFIANYLPRVIVLRLLYGAIGAVVLFLLTRGGLLGGDMFPAFDAKTPWQPEYAKLIVWSFIAGFSERLVPDLLERTEGRGREKA